MSQAFQISTRKSPSGHLRQYRNGVFYGCIEGFECTPPCYTEAQARHEAQMELANGGFRARLCTFKKSYLEWIRQDAADTACGLSEEACSAVMARIRRIDELLGRLNAVADD